MPNVINFDKFTQHYVVHIRLYSLSLRTVCMLLAARGDHRTQHFDHLLKTIYELIVQKKAKGHDFSTGAGVCTL